MMASWRGMEGSGGGSRGPTVSVCAIRGVAQRSLVALVIPGVCGVERKDKNKDLQEKQEHQAAIVRAFHPNQGFWSRSSIKHSC